MGFSNVYIVGMDHRFSQHTKGQENKPSIIQSEDVDHFHPSYFGQGKSWDLPDLENSEISYKSALKVFNESGRGIYDCTINGACTIFPRLDINAIYSSSAGKQERSQPEPRSLPVPKTISLPGTVTQKICFFPAFSAEDDINFSMIRAAWYLGCIEGSEITVYSDNSIESLDCFDYYDPANNMIFQELRATGRLINKPYLESKEMVSVLHDSNIIICWKDHGYIEDLLGGDELKKLAAKGKKIYRVGASNPSESSIYIEISKDLSAFKPELISECQKKFERFLQRHGAKENAYLFATGPSSNAYHKYHYGGKNSVSIICNSVINDEEMLAAVQPDVLVFADPIFHFGCSTYAKTFREKLLKVSAIYDFDIVIPIKYYPIFTYHMPELEDRLIGIPHYKEKGINLDLGKDFFINTMSNILTYLMLPIGASLAKNLYVIGCDGRPLEEDDYFWGHNDKTQFSSEMGAIQKAHPSFFKVDYNEYYLAHCQHLEDYATKLEENNQRLYSMWGSHIPTLIERLHIPNRLKTDRAIISINPDLRSNFGHWAHYDRRLADTTDDLFLTLANKKLAINPVEFFTIPAFSNDVFAIKNNYTEETKQRLEEQFSQAVDLLFRDLEHDTRLGFIMYSGDITYIDALDTIFSCMGPNVTLSVNLFYSHFDYEVNSGEFVRHAALYDKILSADYLQKRPWLKLFVDSERMQSILSDKFEVHVGLWPMVNLDVNRHIIRNIGPKPEIVEKLVVFPGNGQLAKGFDLACDFISKYGQQLSQTYNCRFVLRDMMRDSAQNNEMMEQKLDQISRFAFVDILKGTLSEEEFLKLFYHADLIILPYRKRNFYSRTSSCVVNAILSGKPVLATGDTWLGDQIDRFDAGLTFSDGDIEAMFEAFCKLADRPHSVSNLASAYACYNSSNILPAIL
jgi:glycosyltransferase involved in cell wall biosynthesis